MMIGIGKTQESLSDEEASITAIPHGIGLDTQTNKTIATPKLSINKKTAENKTISTPNTANLVPGYNNKTGLKLTSLPNSNNSSRVLTGKDI